MTHPAGRQLHVGPDQEFATPQLAAKASAPGDTIVIHGSTYRFNGNEYYARYNPHAPILIEHSLSFIGVGDVIFDIGYVSKGALVTAGDAGSLYVENITFQGANNRDFNGAGIRHQAGDLTVVDSVFRGNENGILGGDEGGAITILDSEFDANGKGDGFSHGIYVNRTDGVTLTVEGSHFHDTRVGHHIKSLAETTVVRGSILDDGPNGTSSMAIDVTAGGDLLVENNTIIQSATSDNPRMIYYDLSRNDAEEGDVVIRNNIFENHHSSGEIVGNGTPRMVIDFENNIIRNHGEDLIISEGLYNSLGNTFNDEQLPDGNYIALNQPDAVIPESLKLIVPKAPFEYAEGPNGVYQIGRWGKSHLVGTDDVDVLKAVTKGMKTLEGGLGDDVYILQGQSEIIERAGEGFDWAIGGGGWGFTLPEHVDAYWNTSSTPMRMLNGNDDDNILIGAGGKTGQGETLNGRGGDDTLYGGGTGGDVFHGGPGTDTVLFVGGRADYVITHENGLVIVTYADGSRDTVASDVEFLQFDDQVFAFDSVVSGEDPGPADEFETSDYPVAVPDLSDLDALAADGVYLTHGWGRATLGGTPGADVLEARTKGLKTMIGGAGDDVHLLNGQWAIVEEADGGFDWAVSEGGWGITLPPNVEGYWNRSADPMRHINGNSADNVLIGGGPGETLRGYDGDDILFGGGGGGDTFFGGAGTDTVVFAGDRDDYEIAVSGSFITVTYDDGAVDLVWSDVELFNFAGEIIPADDLLMAVPG